MLREIVVLVSDLLACCFSHALIVLLSSLHEQLKGKWSVPDAFRHDAREGPSPHPHSLSWQMKLQPRLDDVRQTWLWFPLPSEIGGGGGRALRR